MDLDEGIQMLLKRAGVLTPDHSIEQVPPSERDAARDIVQAMGGLPLALDQAGAYIEETQSSLATYLQTYRQKQTALLQRLRCS